MSLLDKLGEVALYFYYIFIPKFQTTRVAMDYQMDHEGNEWFEMVGFIGFLEEEDEYSHEADMKCFTWLNCSFFLKFENFQDK